MAMTKRMERALAEIWHQMGTNAELGAQHQGVDAASDYAMACAYAIALVHVYDALGDTKQVDQLRDLQGVYARQEYEARQAAQFWASPVRAAQH